MEDRSASRCPECGASVPQGGTCMENLHALLLLESEVPGGPGGPAHFFAVASYNLQHPDSMGFTVETIEGIRAQLAGVLAGQASLEDVRRRVRYVARQAGRVTRRGDERVPHWPVDVWPMVVTDVLAAGVDGYAERVERWAGSVVAATEGLHP